jgi:hypothetical protein
MFWQVAEANSVCSLLKKISEARRAKWNVGIWEYWALNASFHYSILPLFQSLLRFSEAISRNEAYESFSAACH